VEEKKEEVGNCRKMIRKSEILIPFILFYKILSFTFKHQFHIRDRRKVKNSDI